MKCVVDRYKWHRPFPMATTVLRNGNDRLRKGNLPRRKLKKGTSDLLLENLGIQGKQEFVLFNFNTILRFRLNIEISLLFKEAIFKFRVIS